MNNKITSTMKKNWLILLGVLLSVGLKAQGKNEKFTAFFNKMVGEWLIQDQESIEKWVKSREQNYMAVVFEPIGEDTLIEETIQLTYINNDFFYEATVVEQIIIYVG